MGFYRYVKLTRSPSLLKEKKPKMDTSSSSVQISVVPALFRCLPFSMLKYGWAKANRAFQIMLKHSTNENCMCECASMWTKGSVGCVAINCMGKLFPHSEIYGLAVIKSRLDFTTDLKCSTLQPTFWIVARLYILISIFWNSCTGVFFNVHVISVWSQVRFSTIILLLLLYNCRSMHLLFGMDGRTWNTSLKLENQQKSYDLLVTFWFICLHHNYSV